MGKRPEEWFVQAAYDMKTAEIMFDNARYIYSVFMCHLSLEKGLKGLYAQRLKEVPPKIHNLIYLIEKIRLNFLKSYMILSLLLTGRASPHAILMT